MQVWLMFVQGQEVKELMIKKKCSHLLYQMEDKVYKGEQEDQRVILLSVTIIV